MARVFLDTLSPLSGQISCLSFTLAFCFVNSQPPLFFFLLKASTNTTAGPKHPHTQVAEFIGPCLSLSSVQQPQLGVKTKKHITRVKKNVLGMQFYFSSLFAALIMSLNNEHKIHKHTFLLVSLRPVLSFSLASAFSLHYSFNWVHHLTVNPLN